jgi:uncharacterized protein
MRACWRQPDDTMKNRPANPVLWLVIALPLLAVAASLASLALAVTRGDPELPKDYHWEGAALDSDQQRLATAAQQGIGATISYQADTQHCTVALHGAAPAQLRLDLVHPTDPRADRRVTMARTGSFYSADCGGLPAAHWWLEISDEAGGWMLRGRTAGRLQPPVQLGAP